MEQINHPQFVALLNEQFPAVAAAIDECSQGLLHCEMGTLARATQTCLKSGDSETARKHFAFVDEVFQNADRDVQNAVYVSYLENLQFEGANIMTPQARELLTPRLRTALIELEEYLDRLFSGGSQS
jgi:hypothetical protein